MAGVRSILWVGRGEGLRSGGVADAAALDVAWARDAGEASQLPLGAFDALVLDAEEPRQAVAALERLRREPALPPVLVRVAPEHRAQAALLRDAGAAEVATHGRRGEGDGPDPELLLALERMGERASAQRRRATPAGAERSASLFPGIVGESAAMRGVFELAARAARSQATVLLAGETGTGKEILAHAIHAGSARAKQAFVGVNCAAFPDTLLESELFGHVRGSFTGAERDKKGLIEEADGGTLFLDEVGETSGPLQAKLLRALQEREVRPVGAPRARRVDVRLIAATNRDLRLEVASGRFREDLYYRLSVFPVRVPPLRERVPDVLPLARHFLALHGRREGKEGCALAPEAEHLLQAYAWPGNVRELENEIQRALALAEPGEALAPAHFSERLTCVVEPALAVARDDEPLRQTMGRIEAWLIRRALEAHGNRRAATARRLGITREGLYKKMSKYGIS